MSKPKGGRGYKAPYETHQIRVPDPIAPQIHQLIEKYQDYIAEGGNPKNPPILGVPKVVDNFREELTQANNQLEECRKEKHECSTLMQRAITILEESLKLKANAGGAIKREVEKAILVLRS